MQELQIKNEGTQISMADLYQAVMTINNNVGEISSKVSALEKGSAMHTKQIYDLEYESTITPAEADDLSKAVRKKGVTVLGGLQSNAYKNKEIRKRVYQDIYMEIKRQYGLIDEAGRQQSYKKLKRKYLKGALDIVEAYEAPIAIQNDIEAENDLEDMDE